MSAMQATNGGIPDAAVIERVVALGDLKELRPVERTAYYLKVCQSLGLNPMTQPFAYITLNGKLTLYAKRDTTDQLRKIHNISVTIVSRENVGDIYVVTARAKTPDGRQDESIGAVSVAGLKGENLANALMKAETKAKRRVTLSICGLGWLDETEVTDVRGARPVTVTDDGEIIDAPQEQAMVKQLRESIDPAKWAQQAMSALRSAKSSGELNGIWAEVERERKALGLAKDHEAAVLVTDCKNELRDSLKEAGQ